MSARSTGTPDASPVGSSRPPATALEEDPLNATIEELIGRLDALAATPGAKLTCDDLIAVIGSRSHALALFVFSLLNLLPGPPGYGVMVGLVLIALAVLLTIDHPLHLWGLVGKRRLPLKGLVKLFGILRWITRAVSRVSAPRLMVLTSRPAMPAIGAFTVVLGLTLLVPIPFSNVLPTIGLALLSLGILNRDGLFVILGGVVGVGGMVVVVVATWLLVALLIAVEQVASEL